MEAVEALNDCTGQDTWELMNAKLHFYRFYSYTRALLANCCKMASEDSSDNDAYVIFVVVPYLWSCHICGRAIFGVSGWLLALEYPVLLL